MHAAHFPVLVLVFALVGCASAAGSESSPRSPTTQGASAATAREESRVQSAGPLEGLACRTSPDGASHTCTAPGYEIYGAVEACDPQSTSFGAVRADGPVLAVDRLVGGVPVARLAPGQFVCIQFHADPAGDGDGWLYVTAIAPSSVPACASVQCGDPVAHSQRLDRRDGTCRIHAGRYTPACPGGWIASRHVDAFSMGL